MALIELRNVVGGYGGAPILNGVNMAIERSDIGVIVGPNGAGKSTTLKAIFGLLFLPFWIAKTAFRIVGLAIVAPILVLAALVGGAALVLGLLATLILPLVPIVIVALLLWVVIRSFSHRPVRVA